MLGLGLKANRSAPGKPFDPSRLTGLTSWLRADKGVTLSGSLVTAWADQSPNAFTFAPDAGESPTFVASGINGLADMTYARSQALIGTNALLGTSALTAFAVFSSSFTAAETTLWGQSYNGFEWQCRLQTSGKMKFLVLGSSGALSDASVADGNPHVMVATYDNLTMKIYVDGTVASAVTATAAGPITNGAGDRNAAGAGTGPASGNFQEGWSGHIPEVGTYNRVITSTELGQLVAYLKGRAGI